MKSRNDFVSNSSTSNFIVTLDKPIGEYSKEEFHKLFKDSNRGVTDRLYDLIKDVPPRYTYQGESYDACDNLDCGPHFDKLGIRGLDWDWDNDE